MHSPQLRAHAPDSSCCAQEPAQTSGVLALVKQLRRVDLGEASLQEASEEARDTSCLLPSHLFSGHVTALGCCRCTPSWASMPSR